MVRVAAGCLLILATNAAYAVTPEELRAIAAGQESQNNARAGNAQTGNLQTLIPANPQNNTTPPPAAAPATGGTAAPYHANQASNGPSINTGSNRIVSDAVTPTEFYGVRLGTWMPARLNRNISSAEIGKIEVTLTAAVIGDKRTIPAGSTIFCNTSLNGATKRLDLIAVRGITPAGKEFALKGIAYDPLQVAGLPGIIQIDKNAIASHSATKGVAAAVGSLGQKIAGNNPLASAGAAATQTALSDTSPGLEYNTAPTAVIYVAPQDLLVRVEEQF